MAKRFSVYLKNLETGASDLVFQGDRQEVSVWVKEWLVEPLGLAVIVEPE